MKNYNSLLALFLIGLNLISACKTPTAVYWEKSQKEKIFLGHTTSKLLDNAKIFPWYYYGKRAYHPNDSLVQYLKPLTDSLGVMIVAGTWCGDTQIELPKMMRLLQKLEINDSLVAIQLVDRKKQNRFFITKPMHVKAIPCFIFYKQGKEIGRIIEHPSVSIEADLLLILKNK